MKHTFVLSDGSTNNLLKIDCERKREALKYFYPSAQRECFLLKSEHSSVIRDKSGF